MHRHESSTWKGDAVDEIICANDRARLQKRIVITDSACYDTLVVIPL